MPYLEPVVLEGRTYELRHVGPASQLWPNGIPLAISPTQVLQQALVGRMLPQASVPNSVDFASGSWTTRLTDAGELQLTFPNKEASDGLPWRDRFDPGSGGLKNEWIEIRSDGTLESVCCIEVVDKQRDHIQIAGHDGMWQLKNAYERDWVTVQAPRDIIERATCVWREVASDDFSYDGSSVLGSQWTTNVFTSSASNVPTVRANDASIGTASWGDVMGGPNILSVGGAVIVGSGSFLTTQYMKLTGFGFSVPANAVIQGIQVSVVRAETNSYAWDAGVRLVKAGTVQGVGDRSAIGSWQQDNGFANDSARTYGSSGDLWSASWTPADINNAGFGFALAANLSPNVGAGQVILYGQVTITVWYVAGSALLLPSGGMQITAPATDVQVTTTPAPLASQTGAWWADANFICAPTSNQFVQLWVKELDNNDNYRLMVTGISGNTTQALATLTANFLGTTIVITQQIPVSLSYDLHIESDGEWVAGYVNSQLVQGVGGGVRRGHTTTNSFAVILEANALDASTFATVVTSIQVDALQPWLMRGTDKGDYALPSITGFVQGIVASYPTGGLHSRYHNNGDLGSDTDRLAKIHHFSRSQAYVGSTGGPGEYSNIQDAGIKGQQNPLPGAAQSNWSVIWFGAIYLDFKASADSYSFSLTMPAVSNDVAFRAFIGKTTPGTELASQWGTSYTNTSGQVFTFSLTGATMAGSRPYSGGPIYRAGWYPIKIEYSVDSTNATAPTFAITHSPYTYTDPGGTVILAGNQSTTVPPTSLSPLGCVDQRHQGISHFDMVQKNSQAFGYQTCIEPQSLESGLFPGTLAPRFRAGLDYDILLQPDDVQRVEGMVNYSNKLDAADCITSLIGNGAGFQNGNTGQLQAIAFDHTSLENSLFDVQGWQDFSDASFGPLLEALLLSQLGLRLQPWQIITGDPIARQRRANTWPLPSGLTAMLWRPGDGVRVYARDVGIQDLVPRQLLTVTRNIAPNGTTGVQVGFAERPRSADHTLRQLIFQAQRWQRNYQRTLTTLNGNLQQSIISASSTDTGSTTSTLSSGDQVVSAWLRVSFPGTPRSINIIVNGVDQTIALKGPWTSAGPFTINLGAVIVPDSANRLQVQLHNNDVGNSASVAYQLLVDVLH